MKKILFSIIALAIAGTDIGKTQDTRMQNLVEHVYYLAGESMEGRAAGSAEAMQAAEYIADRFKDYGLLRFEGEDYLNNFHLSIGVEDIDHYTNVVAILPGSDPRLMFEYIVIGAHYDHIGYKETENGKVIYPGADDNASGVAVLLELAKNLSDIQSYLKRSIIFVAFDAEEIGLHGSKYFVDNPPVPADAIKAMINLDMVGWYKASNRVYYIGTGTLKNAEYLLTQTARVPAGLNIESKKFDRSLMTSTDSEPFARAGIPTFHVTTGTKSPYHKPEDTADKIDYSGMTLVADHLTSVVKELSGMEEIEATGKQARKHRTVSVFEGGLSVLLGNNHYYYTRGELDGKNGFSFGGGLYSQINLGVFAIRPEVYYDRLQGKFPYGNITTNAVTVPLNILIQTPRKSAFGVYVGFGGYYRHTFSGDQKNSQVNFGSLYYRNEGGMSAIGGIWIYNIGLGYTYRRSFTNLIKDRTMLDPVIFDRANIRNNSSFFHLYYRF